jgi:hypothetical protein
MLNAICIMQAKLYQGEYGSARFQCPYSTETGDIRKITQCNALQKGYK